MSELHPWVCLKCYNQWDSSKGSESKPQCSNNNCKSRLVVLLPDLKQHIESVKQAQEKLPPPAGEPVNLPLPNGNLIKLLQSGQSILQTTNPRAAEGVDLLGAIIQIADEWGGEEPVEDAIDRLHDRS